MLFVDSSVERILLTEFWRRSRSPHRSCFKLEEKCLVVYLDKHEAFPETTYG